MIAEVGRWGFLDLLGPNVIAEMHIAHVLSHPAVLFETRYTTSWAEPFFGFMRHLSQYQNSPEATRPSFTLPRLFPTRQVQFVLAKVTDSEAFFSADDFFCCVE